MCAPVLASVLAPVLAAALLLAGAAGAMAQAVFPPGVSIGLAPPPGMGPSAGFAGFQHPSGASIVVVEMPAEAYAQLTEKFTPETLRSSGFIVAGAAQPLQLADGEGRLLRGTQDANGQTYAKWVVIARGPGTTALVTAQVPEGARAQVSDAAVEAALRSIAFRPQQSLQDQIGALPFTIGDTAGFRAVRVIAGSGLLLTDGPKDVDPDATQPIVVVASSLGAPTSPADQDALARRALGTLAQMSEISITDEKRAMRGAATVLLLHATAKDARSGRLVQVTQTVIFSEGRYVRVVGIAPADRADAIARTDRLAGSVVLR
ncbi:hypothetical protein [Azorhizobium doebereinerae]|uniref:hypothetical protein n=1 Tax=Azorhizobium doebereinerae TaxID=281091 RepID=UPI001FD98627|nr:hypothetical protein [Azorhizobium doebereinerae]